MGESLQGKSFELSLFQKTVRSWWVMFLFLIAAIYFQAAYSRHAALSSLSSRLKEMENAKAAAIGQQADLVLQLQSESDPAWIELVLMKELGVVPEGWTKVHFKKSP
jgi:hypothetical protein